MFSNLWPGLEVDDVPIGHITNGVHAGTWITRDCAEVYERRLGPDYGVRSESWDAVFKLRDEELWGVRTRLRRRLVDEIRTRLRSSWRKLGVADEQLGWVDRAFDPRVLTVGFARRVPSYKRLTLILRNPERLRRLLLDDERPIQIVVAGKSHPADDGGKKLLKQFVEFAADHDVRHRIVFLPDYDMAMARFLVAGADVWLNNPLRPFEACGTSGMKAALNGVPSLSVLDGWWPEGWVEGVTGWSIGTGTDYEPDQTAESASLYNKLEYVILPLFYGSPMGYARVMRSTIAINGSYFTAQRMVQQYAQTAYQLGGEAAS
jgi:starch phosphorylase